jgi:hypothetical protein
MKFTAFYNLFYLIQKNNVYTKDIDVLKEDPELALMIYFNYFLIIIGVVLILRLYFRIMKYLNLKIKHLQKKTET